MLNIITNNYLNRRGNFCNKQKHWQKKEEMHSDVNFNGKINNGDVSNSVKYLVKKISDTIVKEMVKEIAIITNVLPTACQI